jgi:hypothetical protein
MLLFFLPLLVLAIWLGIWGRRRYGYDIWTPTVLIVAILVFSALTDR